MAELDDQTEALVQQLYNAWSTNADPTSYLNLRDQILSQRERADTCITTLKTVLTVTCPQIPETERYFDPKWEELFALAESIEPSAEEDDVNLGKRKRTYNEVHSLRNLAVVSALWSPGVVRHYGWNSVGQGCLRLLKTCALRFPDFGKQFCPYLNRVLLDRHCEAIVSGHLKTLSEAPLQCYRDLNIVLGGGVVPNLETEELWVTNSDGVVPVDSNGRLLKDVRPYHVQQHLLRRDRYGMLVARGDEEDLTLNAHQQSDFWLTPSVHEGCLADDDGLGLTFSSADIITPSGVDYLLDGLAFTYQAETLPYGANGTSTITLPSNNAVGLASNPSQEPILPFGADDASSITLLSDNANGLALNPNQVPILYSVSSSDVSEQYYAGSDDAPSMSTGTRKNRKRQSRQDSVASLSRPTTAARLPASPANSRARTGAFASQPKEKPTMEDKLRNKHKQMLSKYTERLREEAMPGYDQRLVRSQWLTSDTKWARIWSVDGSKSLLPGAATSKANCDVLYCSADSILEAARSGEVFQKPVVIKESFSDAGMHNYERMVSLLEDASSSDEQVEVRCIDIKQPMHEALGKFTAYLRSHHESTDGLWMSTTRSVAKCHRPLFTMLNRFRLLESLSEGLHDDRAKSAQSPLLKYMSGSSTTISFPGAFSGAYLNTTAGSWQRNLSGVKFWVFVPVTGLSSDELASLVNEGNGWLPREKQRLVVLEENDVLFVPPGLRLVQAWHTPTTCLTEEGRLWDDLSILSIVESMTRGCEDQAIQDDCAAQQLFRMMNNLDRLVSEQPDRFRRGMAQDEFIGRFREA
ncbi:hypothetical protein E8E11_000118, partial [Didymella keratinophila]